MYDPERQRQERHDLARALRELRRASGLSGERLAARCALSQSKISRIETGRILPSVIDVQRMLDALEVSAEVGKPLLDLARAANVHYRSWRSYAETGLWRKQEEIAALVTASSVVRHLTPAAPPGLLQTREFATAVLSSGVAGRPAVDVERVVEARMRLGRTLHDPARRFVFVLTEQSIRWPRAPSDVLAAQCAHIAELTAMENLTIALVPNTAQVTVIPLSSFVVHDERLVVVETFSGEMVLRDPKDISYHINIVDHLLERALTGPAAADFLHAAATRTD